MQSITLNSLSAARCQVVPGARTKHAVPQAVGFITRVDRRRKGSKIRPTVAFLVLATIGLVEVKSAFAKDPLTPSSTGQISRSGAAGGQADNSHPLDPALKVAYDSRDYIERNIRDYTAILIKRERIKGELTDHQFMSVKIRNKQMQDDKIAVPFSVYMKFLKPRSVEGREVIWVEGQNDGKLLAHEGGLKNLLVLKLDPSGTLAMMGQRYPIYEIGIKNLIDKLIEKGERDHMREECEVKFFRNAKIEDRPCLMIQVKHPQPRPYFDFHVAEVFMDDQFQVPVRYAAHQWPKSSGGEPILDEEYTYRNLKINVGLEDLDFDPKNPEYHFR